MGGWPISDERLRAMYRGDRGDRTARRFARMWALIFSWGVLPRRWVTLEVPGRRSGRTTRFPLGMVSYDGDWFLASMLGERCNWVRNVRAAGGLATLRRRRAVPVRLIEVPIRARAPIIRSYLRQVPGARPHIHVDRHAPVTAFAAVAQQVPVFRVELRDRAVRRGRRYPRRTVRPSWQRPPVQRGAIGRGG